MPQYPVPPWMRWQMQVTPVVQTNFARPFYLNPSNNLPGGAQPRPQPVVKPPVIEHVRKPTRREAWQQASSGTVLPVGLKVTDG